MDINRIVSNLCGDDFTFNPDFINFTESEAVERGLWPADKEYLTAEEIEAEGERIKDEDEPQLITNKLSREFLTGTDWKITRHNEQLSRDTETSLTSEEFEALLNERQEKRDSIID